MEENRLKKEFKPRDVQRMRNILTNNPDAATQLQAGYELNKIRHVEGDIWEENGKTWTIIKGLKQNLTKLDDVKNIASLPLICPKCNSVMEVNRYNKKMWAIHRTCFSCVVKMETELKRTGKWEEYCTTMLNNNKDAMLSDLETALDTWVGEKDVYVTEAGEVESWNGGDKTAIYKQAKEQIAELKKQDIYNK